jgi:hypothetical protein
MYIMSSLSGSIKGAGVMNNNLDNLPDKSNLLGRLSTIALGQSINVINPRISGFKLTFADPAITINYYLDLNNTYSDTHSLGFGEYITSVKVHYADVNFYATSTTMQSTTAVVGIELSFSGDSKPLTMGTISAPNPAVFNAPSGWRIVGFHGRYNTTYSSYYNQNVSYYTQMGVIYAPV